jgi:integrase
VAARGPGLTTLFNWCVPRYIKHSPCTGLKAPKPTARSRVFTDAELRTIFLVCKELGQYGTIIYFCALLGLRRGEASNMRPEFLDLTSRTLVIPAHLVKNNRNHSMPFGDLSMQYLLKCPFSSNSWTRHTSRLRKTIGFNDFCIHTLRHAYRSNLARLKVPPHIAERLVGHISSRSPIEPVYDHWDYADECRAAQEKYKEWFMTTILCATEPKTTPRSGSPRTTPAPLQRPATHSPLD